MQYFSLKNNLEEIIYSNVPEEFRKHEQECKTKNTTFVYCGRKIRHVKISNENGNAYFLTDDREIVERPRYFNEKISVLLENIFQLKEIENKIKAKSSKHNQRLIHNLRALNAHNIQELFNLVSEEELRQTIEKRKSLIKQRVKESIEIVPNILINLMKNNAAIKMEFSIFEKLQGIKEKNKAQRHNIRKALMNILHLFFQDFSDKNVNVVVDECDTDILIDYEILQVSLYQLFDNAAKYCMNNSDVKISFDLNEKSLNVNIDMVSIKIEKHEIPKITQEGFCGENAIKIRKNGKGIGMYVIKKVLNLSHSRLSIYPCFNSVQINLDKIDYEGNRFTISFPKNIVNKPKI